MCESEQPNVIVCLLFYRDSTVCPDRHRFNSQLDQSELPASGLIEVSMLGHLSVLLAFHSKLVQYPVKTLSRQMYACPRQINMHV